MCSTIFYLTVVDKSLIGEACAQEWAVWCMVGLCIIIIIISSSSSKSPKEIFDKIKGVYGEGHMNIQNVCKW